MKMKKADGAVAIYIMAAIIMFIVPIPSWLLDILLAINISVALTILFATMFSKEVLDMSFFPTMLLFTTIFRIALNTSSTRLILRDGNAGNVVETFGEFVGGGDLVIGVIIFIILILIQFMVINKGSERVSEVTARFTLDAMPGKQMAIDADLNTGAITDAEAKKRREKIQEEASFFGSMDGAVKYVKGDAVAGLLITTINIVGGIIMGMTRQGMDITSALNKYAILTIGDGLVSQIPSLLISLSTGILVTKGSKDADFGTTLVSQLFGVPKGLYLVGAMLAILGFVTELNTILFVGLGLVFIIVARNIEGTIETAQIEQEVDSEEAAAEEIRQPENVNSLLQVDTIELEFGYGIIPLADVNQGGDLLDRVVMIRRQIALELGTVVPIIRLRDNIQLNPNQYIIKIKGIQVSEGEILFDHYMAMNPGYVEEEITGIPTFEPSFHLPAIWITEGQRERAESLGYTVVDPPSIIATHLTEIIRQHIADAGAPAAGGLQRPALAQPAGAAPLVQPGALDHAAERQVDEFACEPVLDAPAALTGVHELPLLPRMARIAPQLDAGAVLRVEILYFQYLPVGGLDNVVFPLHNDDLRCLCHRAQLLSAMVALLYPICPLATRMLFHNLSFVFCAFCRVFAAQTFSEASNVFYRRALCTPAQVVVQ